MDRSLRPVVLIILDGWGINPRTEGNAIALASPPVYNALLREYPNTTLDASGESVGLPEGQMGNSEVGHLNIGAGRSLLTALSPVANSPHLSGPQSSSLRLECMQKT